MKAYLLNRYGGPDSAALGEFPCPEPAPGEVRIRVQAAGLNPVDYKIRQGKLRAIHRPRLPCVMGNELAGVVDIVGKGVGRFAPGDRVYARVAKEKQGAFAEFVCVDETLVARAPSSVDAIHAAAVPLAALTALQALREQLNCGPGQALLITGGSGGVGSFAIPLARWMGAEVTVTASPRGETLVRNLGAHAVIDYTRESLAGTARRFDAVFDLIGGPTLEQCFGAVRPGGRVVSVAGVPEPRTARIDLQRGAPMTWLFWLISRRLRALARRNGVDYRYLFMRPDSAQLQELAELIDVGTLPVTLDRVFEFDRIHEAMAWIEAGRAKGKVVVRMSD